MLTYINLIILFTHDSLISGTSSLAFHLIGIIISISNKDPPMIKLGTTVQHKLHDDLNGDVVLINRKSNTAAVKYWINDYEPMIVDVYLSDLEVA